VLEVAGELLIARQFLHAVRLAQFLKVRTDTGRQQNVNNWTDFALKCSPSQKRINLLQSATHQNRAQQIKNIEEAIAGVAKNFK
jgi:hypothetical protein